MRYWGDIELPDEDELAALKALTDLHQIDPPSPTATRSKFVRKSFQRRHWAKQSISCQILANEPVPLTLLWQRNCPHLAITPSTIDQPDTGGATNVSSQLWIGANLVCLQRAVLCANCEVISEGKNGQCAGCGSQALLSLSKLLGGSVSAEMSCLTLSDSDRVASEAVYLRFLSVA